MRADGPEALLRIGCSVPFCNRTGIPDREGHDEWLCATHYRAVDARIKRLRRRIASRMSRAGFPEFLGRMDSRLWQKAKAQAIERAGGI